MELLGFWNLQIIVKIGNEAKFEFICLYKIIKLSLRHPGNTNWNANVVNAKKYSFYILFGSIIFLAQ